MIHAIENGKVPTRFLDGEESLMCEDTLTSVVIERLIYLGGAVWAKLLSKSAVHPNWNRSIDPGEIQSIEFWPSWSFDGRRIEPDCLIRFRSLDLIIEAKRWDGMPQQYMDQWKRELQAYRLSISNHANRVAFLALGGHQSIDHESIEVRWSKLVESTDIFAVTTEFYLLEESWEGLWSRLGSIKSELPDMNRFGASQIFEDIRAGMELHGIRVVPPAWFGTLPTMLSTLRIANKREVINLSNAEQHLSFSKTAIRSWDQLIRDMQINLECVSRM